MALPSSRTIIVAGAGIGGLTAALALARNGFRALVIEQAERLEETGAGIQLSPNATRILIGLGLSDRLQPHVVAPTAVRVLAAHSARNRAHTARQLCGDALRRALLGHPPRRLAGRVKRRSDAGSQYRDPARHVA